MASLAGYNGLGMPVVTAVPGSANGELPGTDASRNMVVIDGTPIRVVVIAIAAAAGLTALRWAGFKFNVAASTG